MGKYKYLIKNIGLLTISNFGGKVLSFILIPLYTSILSTAEYGTYDIYTTTISLVIPILSINISSGVLRFSIGNEENTNNVLRIGLKFCIKATIIFCILIGVNFWFKIISIFNNFPICLILYMIINMFYDLISQFSRGIDRIADIAVAGLLNSVIMLSLNILFLVVFHMGLEGYFWATILSYAIPLIYLCIRINIWKFFLKTSIDKKLEKNMKKYSIPMAFSTIAWWVTNVSDRYIVTWICGVAVNGIYSVAYKIPSLLNVFQSIFNQAWMLSAVQEYNKDKNKFYSEVYGIYNVGMVIVCSGLILLDKVLATILFSKDFYVAWRYAPFLMISVVFGAMAGLLEGIFSATRRTDISAKTTVLGALINLVLNIELVSFWGAIGAAVATMIAYIVVLMTRLIYVKQFVNLKITLKKDIICYILLLGQAVVWIMNMHQILSYVLEIVFTVVVILLYKNEIEDLLNKILQKKNGKI